MVKGFRFGIWTLPGGCSQLGVTTADAGLHLSSKFKETIFFGYIINK